jgi:hypothetical protein
VTKALPPGVFGAAVALIAACAAPRLVTAPSGPQPANAQAIRVDYPPPPAKIEEIPLSHRSNNPCVWRDGFWDWTGRRWEWHGGRAILPATGCYLAEAKLQWTTAFLSFYRPAWYPDLAQAKVAKACAEIACVPAASASPAPAN